MANALIAGFSRISLSFVIYVRNFTTTNKAGHNIANRTLTTSSLDAASWHFALRLLRPLSAPSALAMKEKSQMKDFSNGWTKPHFGIISTLIFISLSLTRRYHVRILCAINRFMREKKAFEDTYTMDTQLTNHVPTALLAKERQEIRVIRRITYIRNSRSWKWALRQNEPRDIWFGYQPKMVRFGGVRRRY